MSVITMDKKQFVRAQQDFNRTGRQDAQNVLDTRELFEEFMTVPTIAQIKSTLAIEPEDLEAGLDFPDDATLAQKKSLCEHWADGWAEVAHAAVKKWFGERVAERVFHEPAGGMLDEGWYVTRDRGQALGPFKNKDAAMKRAAAAVEGDESDT